MFLRVILPDDCKIEGGDDEPVYEYFRKYPYLLARANAGGNIAKLFHLDALHTFDLNNTGMLIRIVFFYIAKSIVEIDSEEKKDNRKLALNETASSQVRRLLSSFNLAMTRISVLVRAQKLPVLLVLGRSVKKNGTEKADTIKSRLPKIKKLQGGDFRVALHVFEHVLELCRVEPSSVHPHMEKHEFQQRLAVLIAMYSSYVNLYLLVNTTSYSHDEHFSSVVAALRQFHEKMYELDPECYAFFFSLPSACQLMATPVYADLCGGLGNVSTILMESKNKDAKKATRQSSRRDRYGPLKSCVKKKRIETVVNLKKKK